MVRTVAAAIAVTVTVVLAAASPAAAAADPVVVALYGSDHCPYTADMDDLLTRLADTRPQLRIDRYDVDTPTDADRFRRHMDALAHPAGSVPVVVVDHQVFVGASADTRTALTAAVDTAHTDAAPAGGRIGASGLFTDPEPSVFIWFGAPLVIGIFAQLLSPHRPATILSHMAGMSRDRDRTRTVPSAPDRTHTHASDIAAAGRDDTPPPVIDIAPPGPDDAPPPGPTDSPPPADRS